MAYLSRGNYQRYDLIVGSIEFDNISINLNAPTDSIYLVGDMEAFWLAMNKGKDNTVYFNKGVIKIAFTERVVILTSMHRTVAMTYSELDAIIH